MRLKLRKDMRVGVSIVLGVTNGFAKKSIEERSLTTEFAGIAHASSVGTA